MVSVGQRVVRPGPCRNRFDFTSFPGFFQSRATPFRYKNTDACDTHYVTEGLGLFVMSLIGGLVAHLVMSPCCACWCAKASHTRRHHSDRFSSFWLVVSGSHENFGRRFLLLSTSCNNTPCIFLLLMISSRRVFWLIVDCLP